MEAHPQLNRITRGLGVRLIMTAGKMKRALAGIWKKQSESAIQLCACRRATTGDDIPKLQPQLYPGEEEKMPTLMIKGRKRQDWMIFVALIGTRGNAVLRERSICLLVETEVPWTIFNRFSHSQISNNKSRSLFIARQRPFVYLGYFINETSVEDTC